MAGKDSMEKGDGARCRLARGDFFDDREVQ
jgi:hypothetical protein